MRLLGARRQPTKVGEPTVDRRRELDGETLARAQRGDPAAQQTLVETYQRRVFALLTQLLVTRGRAGLVEDLAQETFLRALAALPRFSPDGPARLSSWILTIATRLVLDEEKRRRVPSIPIDTPGLVLAGGEPADLGLVRRERAAAIRRAVEALGAEQRAVFVLRELHDLSYEEIAEALRIDVGTVRSRLSRARAALRDALAEVGDD
jgi:RNA polymerase sigma-70 factor, ECF subfamily